jgi:hypothetical protein
MVLRRLSVALVYVHGVTGDMIGTSSLGIEAHGVLWVSDQLQISGQATFADILHGHIVLDDDPAVWFLEPSFGREL